MAAPNKKKKETIPIPPVQEVKPGDQRETRVLPVRHTVLFPYALLPLNVGRPNSVLLLNECMASDRTLVLVGQRDSTIESPGPQDLHEIGTLATILRMVRAGDSHFAVLVQG